MELATDNDIEGLVKEARERLGYVEFDRRMAQLKAEWVADEAAARAVAWSSGVIASDKSCCG